MYTLKKIRERVSYLLSNAGKGIAVLPPPKPRGFLSAEDSVKEEIFQEHLETMESHGVKVWENPITTYEEDDGLHPSPEQSLSHAM